RGSKREKIWEDHKQLKTYGVGADIHRADWFRYIRELVTLGYLQVTDDAYPVLKLTAKSDAVLRGLEKVELIGSQTIEERQYEPQPFEAGLLNELKSVRRDIAANQNVPAYLILSDAALVEMATYLPQTLDELRLISGFGDVKLARYGREFLIPIKNYCSKNGLSSRMEQKRSKKVQKTRTNVTTNSNRSSNTAEESFHLYRSGKTVTEIAAQRSLATTTVEGHLSYYIYKGEMDVQEMVGEEKKLFIKDTVESYGAERLSPLKEILGEDYSYGEIKAVIAWMRRTGTI
ncbi:MAG TPA: helix-turn-helix domain-containing protein, partial [Mucilaginibacter sp.]|nr:helix-turn-helix domain-containing protein [Mucilaginibacter sp.]